MHSREATEYVFGGEYDLRLSEIASSEDYNPDDYIPYEQWKALVNGEVLVDNIDS
ncbi:hypothetical protein [Okeania sp.]|uniref:hypothetical protein n=1 Tax=Okeania sp. TaxID=3100323 RepID=UPI002B4AF3C8|nr:hypothetical protein [Okeania sp.]MEB3341426.1 hypothetical protein [Okeania sp.]